MKYSLIFVLLIGTCNCGLYSQNIDDLSTKNRGVLKDTIKDPKNILDKVSNILGGNKGNESNNKRETKVEKKNHFGFEKLILNTLDDEIMKFSSTYIYIDKAGERWKGNPNNQPYYAAMNINGFYLTGNELLKPWQSDSTFIKKKNDDKPALGSVTDATNKEFNFTALGKHLTFANATNESHISLGVTLKENKNFIVLSSGKVSEKVHEDYDTYESFDDISVTRIDASYDEYFGTFVLIPKIHNGRIDFQLVAIGMPSFEDGKKGATMYKITEQDISEFNTMRSKLSEKAKSKSTKTSTKSTSKKKKRKGLFRK